MCIKEIHWKKASEELPVRSCVVVAITSDGLVLDVNYSILHKKFNAIDFLEPEFAWADEKIAYWEYKENVVPDDIKEEA